MIKATATVLPARLAFGFRWLRRWRSFSSSGWPWLLPALLVFVAAYAMPLLQMIWLSFADGGLGLQHYEHIFASSTYLSVLLSTLKVGALVVVVCLVVGYPLAYFLSL